MALKYRIGEIGWHNFERLCQTILKVVVGPGVTSFGGTKDGGRDAAFTGSADFPSRTQRWKGNWIFQVKYYDTDLTSAHDARAHLQKSLQNEIRKIVHRQSNRFNNYILLTNVSLTASGRDSIAATFRGHFPRRKFQSIDGNEICEFLDLHPQIRRAFPQLLGLADLENIINRRLYARSRAFVQLWQPRMASFVATEAYYEALSVLRKRHFIVLDGPPEVGKTTIAAALSLLCAAEGYEIFKIRNPDEFFDLAADKSKQLFIADDAVGQVAIDPGLTNSWADDLPAVLQRLDRNHLLIWTARHYILQEAVSDSRLAEAAKDFPGVHDVLVEVGQIDLFQKAEILYLHAKNARFPEAAKRTIRTNAKMICAHPNFTPLRVEQLISGLMLELKHAQNAKTDIANAIAIRQFLNNPGDRWIKAYRKLNKSEKALLLSMLEFDAGALVEELATAYENRTSADEGRLRFADCLHRLDHSFLQVGHDFFDEEVVEFQHPSLRDMLLEELRGDDAVRKRFIAIASPPGVAILIRGVALVGSALQSETHTVSPVSELDFEKLLLRISDVGAGTIAFAHIEDILQATTLLRPRSRSGSPIPVKNLDLAAYQSTKQGRLLHHVVLTFMRPAFYQSNQRFSGIEWLKISQTLLPLSIYVSPRPQLDYASALIAVASNSKWRLGFKLAMLIQRFEPDVVSQQLSEKTLDEWASLCDSDVLAAIEAADSFSGSYDSYGMGPSHSDYIEWKDDAEEIVSLGRKLFKLAHWDDTKGLNRLRKLLDTTVEPFQPDDRDDDSLQRDDESEESEYWSIDRMFEDL